MLGPENTAKREDLCVYFGEDMEKYTINNTQKKY